MNREPRIVAHSPSLPCCCSVKSTVTQSESGSLISLMRSLAALFGSTGNESILSEVFQAGQRWGRLVRGSPSALITEVSLTNTSLRASRGIVAVSAALLSLFASPAGQVALGDPGWMTLLQSTKLPGLPSRLESCTSISTMTKSKCRFECGRLAPMLVPVASLPCQIGSLTIGPVVESRPSCARSARVPIPSANPEERFEEPAVAVAV